ncbi:FAD-dependent oxidoreductase [Mucilaginibacter paludis]|uniref:Glucose-inhibited division protein A n=1 Tax=Mucilaginibacter paludis DSM 18603 TaxID=714943 RepID=H1Y6N6_9SPHI|nr:FAD-dependent oxidoreductase [Mucilaginibacter paludis]EHQ26828.1 glucose-inhibited division protein A [Mucilaginibacter paludis DSM 18603]
MITNPKIFLFLLAFFCFTQAAAQSKTIQTDVLIIGGGASGTTAAIQASRMGVKTLLVEETEWLGGMLTSAGVSAIDGDNNLPSGLWAEFRQKLRDYYGGAAAVETGWVSNTLFEPSVGNKILKQLAVNNNLTIWYKTVWQSVKKIDGGWQVAVKKAGKTSLINARLLIDATELGDVMAAAGVKYDVGMDSRYTTGEAMAPEKANDIVQDMTFVITLKDYGKGADKTIKKPANYNPDEFKCSCDVSDPSVTAPADNNCYQMLQYGRLPNNKYMINWPKCGNDIYLNLIEKTPEEREVLLKEAKLHALKFIYYIQTALGYKNLGIADDEYPTADHLPMLPYHREARRMNGLVKLTLNDIAKPYDQKTALYRTGIAVGDYPVDHHHLKNPSAPAIDFVRIKVPAYNIPLGALIPQQVDGLIVAEKSISVTNIVNGTSRLQPVVLTIGQAAGALAAVCIKNNIQPAQANIRDVQQALLDSKAYLMPFIDVKPEDPNFEALQRIGATGILKGTGLPYKWANQTWFYPELNINEYDLVTGLKMYYTNLDDLFPSGNLVTGAFMVKLFAKLKPGTTLLQMNRILAGAAINQELTGQTVLSRRMVAVLIDTLLKPFDIPIGFDGIVKTTH